MKGKRVLLTLNEKMYDRLMDKANESYMTIQELITNILREDILESDKRKHGKK